MKQGSGVTMDAVVEGIGQRAIALEEWRRRFDPDGRIDAEALREAVGLAPLVAMEDGPGFGPTSFRELA